MTHGLEGSSVGVVPCVHVATYVLEALNDLPKHFPPMRRIGFTMLGVSLLPRVYICPRLPGFFICRR